MLQFTMLDSISLQPARHITEIKKILHSPQRKKKYRVNYNQPKWKSKTRVRSCELRVQIYQLRVQIHELRVQIHELED